MRVLFCVVVACCGGMYGGLCVITPHLGWLRAGIPKIQIIYNLHYKCSKGLARRIYLELAGDNWVGQVVVDLQIVDSLHVPD